MHYHKKHEIYFFKAIPHKDCRADAQSAFSSDCPKRHRNTGVFQGVLGKNDGKDASVCATKRAARSLRSVALIVTETHANQISSKDYEPTYRK